MNNADRIAANLVEVRARIAAAAQRSGRSADDIALVAVTKYVDVPTTRLVIEAGCTALGESRPQQLWEKAEAIDNTEIRWHMVGHLQRNKIRRTLPHVSLIQSIDSEAALLAVDRISGEIGLAANVLLEVNISGDEAKHGLAPSDVAPLLAIAENLTHVSIQGLMSMAALAGNDDVARKNFHDLRELRDQLMSSCPANVSLAELSMGMSGDFESAIEEGATIVRVGSALFDGVTPSES